MARHAHEFSCTNCSWWNYPMLSDTMDGNYVIRCGHCEHEHYRCIKKGRVTEDRHDKSRGCLDVIHVMPSACQQKKRQLGVVAQMRSMLFADGMGGGV